MKTALSLAFLSVLGRGAGFISQWYILAVFGAGLQADALFAGMTVPQLVIVLTSGPLANTLVPLLSGRLDARERRSDAWTIFLGVSAVMSALMVLSMALGPLWVPLLLPGFDDEGRALVVRISQIQLIGLPFIAQYYVVWAHAQAERQFIRVEVALVVSQVVAVAALAVAAQRFGLEGATWVVALRPALETALILPTMGRFGLSERPRAVVGEVWARLRPLLLGSLYYKSDILLERYLLSMAPPGALSLYHLAKQLYTAGYATISKAIVVPTAPTFARLAREERWSAFRSLYVRRALLASGLIAGGYLILVALGRPALGLLVGRAGVTVENQALLMLILLAQGGYLTAMVAQLFAYGFYALGDTKTPTLMGSLAYTVAIGVKVAGFMLGGVVGLAIGVSTHHMLNAALLWFGLEARSRRLLGGTAPARA